MENIVYYRSNYLEIIQLNNKVFNYSEHNHVSVYTIGLVLSGEITLKHDQQSKSYFSPSFFVIAPYQVHALMLSQTYNMLSICINKNLVNNYSSSDLLKLLFDTISQLAIDVDLSLIKPLLIAAIDVIYPTKINQPPTNVIFSSAELIRLNPENNYCLPMIANKACYSMYHFIKLFRQQIGITPHKFQIQNRIRKAQKMLEHNNPIVDIALALGFYDQSHFIKCFKRIVGLTPLEYQKSVKKTL